MMAALLLVACGGDDEERSPAVAPIEEPDPELEPDPEPEPAPEPDPEPELTAVAPLTGVAGDAEDEARWSSRPAATVKMPNDPSARPQTGLEHADVVFEQETEYGVTRFAAVFHSSIPDVVGNIRSARLVDPEIVAPFDGVMVYSGGRETVRQRVADAGLVTVTEGGPGFYRDSARSAPHNLYSRLPEVVAARSEVGSPAPLPWRFDEQAPSGGTPVDGRFEVAVSAGYTTGWEYDEDAAVFRRFQNGSYHAVTGPDAIGAANVVLLEVGVSGRDSHGAPVYELSGSGDAVLLRDGARFDISWEKQGRDSQLQLTDGAAAAVLRPGPTWVVLTYEQVTGGL